MVAFTGTEAPAGTASTWLRTLRGTFTSNLTSQVRSYTLTGWAVSTSLHPLFLVATAWAVGLVVTGGEGGAPQRFVDLTGYTDYVSFVLLGFAFNGLALAAMEDGGNSVYEEERWGTWELVALTPFHRFTWLFAKTLAGVVASLVDLVAVLVVGGLVFGLQVTPATVGVAALAVFLTLLGLVGFGFLFAALGIVWKEPRALTVILSPFIILLTGMMFPVEALPSFLHPVSAAIPLTHGIDIVREALLLGHGLAEVSTSFLWLVGTGAAHMVVGYGAFRWFEDRARHRGDVGKY